MLYLFLDYHRIGPENVYHYTNESYKGFQCNAICFIVFECSTSLVVFIQEQENEFTVWGKQNPENSRHNPNNLLFVDLNPVEIVINNEHKEGTSEVDSVGDGVGKIVVRLGVQNLMDKHQRVANEEVLQI